MRSGLSNYQIWSNRYLRYWIFLSQYLSRFLISLYFSYLLSYCVQAIELPNEIMHIISWLLRKIRLTIRVFTRNLFICGTILLGTESPPALVKWYNFSSYILCKQRMYKRNANPHKVGRIHSTCMIQIVSFPYTRASRPKHRNRSVAGDINKFSTPACVYFT